MTPVSGIGSGGGGGSGHGPGRVITYSFKLKASDYFCFGGVDFGSCGGGGGGEGVTPNSRLMSSGKSVVILGGGFLLGSFSLISFTFYHFPDSIVAPNV